MSGTYIRSLILAGLAAFVPLFYYLAVVGGFLPYGGILMIGVRNLSDPSLLLFSVVHLGVYGLFLYWLSGLIARILGTRCPAPARCWRARSCCCCWQAWVRCPFSASPMAISSGSAPTNSYGAGKLK